MIKLLDAVTYWLKVLGAAAFAVTFAIAAAHSISKEATPLWRLSSFRKWLAVTFLVLVLVIAPTYVINKAIQTELNLLVKKKGVLAIILYTADCKIFQPKQFLRSLAKADAVWPSGSRTTRQSYKVAVLDNDTLARFELIQNSWDSTIYKVYYFSDTTAHQEDIGVVKINPSLSRQCK